MSGKGLLVIFERLLLVVEQVIHFADAVEHRAFEAAQAQGFEKRQGLLERIQRLLRLAEQVVKRTDVERGKGEALLIVCLLVHLHRLRDRVYGLLQFAQIAVDDGDVVEHGDLAATIVQLAAQREGLLIDFQRL
jgi:hypothetical protein